MTTSPASARPRRRIGCASNIPPDRKAHWMQPGVGHYGVFNGSRFRSEIVPRISDFVLSNNFNSDAGAGKRARRVVRALAKTNGSAHPTAAVTPSQVRRLERRRTRYPILPGSRARGPSFALRKCRLAASDRHLLVIRHGRRIASDSA